MSKERFVSRVTLGPVRLVININQQRDGKSSEGQKRKHGLKKTAGLAEPQPHRGHCVSTNPTGLRRRETKELGGVGRDFSALLSQGTGCLWG